MLLTAIRLLISLNSRQNYANKYFGVNTHVYKIARARHTWKMIKRKDIDISFLIFICLLIYIFAIVIRNIKCLYQNFYFLYSNKFNDPSAIFSYSFIFRYLGRLNYALDSLLVVGRV